MEHLVRFGLERDPFRCQAQLEFWFASRTHVHAGRRLRRCVEQGKELCALVGPVGSGTTTVLRALFEQLDADRFEALLLVPLRGVGPDELRAMIARQLGVEVPAHERSQGLREFYERLAAHKAAGRHVVVGIDEAHTLSRDSFAELRALLQLECDEERPLSLVLAGTPELSDAIAGDTGLAGRVDLQVTIEPLSREEAHAYLSHRIAVAGGDPALFDARVLDAIAARAAGLPRRLNALADATLFEAHLAEHARPTLEDVESAARDLPWARAGGVVRAVAAGDDLLDASLGAVPPIESLREADSASLAALDLPEEEPERDGAARVARALASEESMVGRFAVDRTVRDASLDEALECAEETAPGAWQSPLPLDDDATASRLSAPLVSCDEPLVASEDELDDLFVDLVDEVEPER